LPAARRQALPIKRRGKALEMLTNFSGYVSTKALRGALVVARGATLAALAAVALVAASGTAVGQQQGQEAPPSQGQESSAEPGFAPAERVVGFNEGVTNTTQGLEQAAEASGGRVVDRLDDPQNRAVLLKFPTEQAAQAAAEGLAKRPDVQYVERNGIVEGTSVSSDPQVGSQWHHTVIRKTANLGTLPSAPPTIAVVDSGVDYNHPDLAGKVIKGPDFVNNDLDPMDDIPSGHGTHVAGIAAATAGNGIGVEGVSPNSKILAIKVLSSSNLSFDFDVAQGLAYARTVKTTPATKVINTSLCADLEPGVPEGPQLLADEVDDIKDAGKILVASAGNENSSPDNDGCTYPGNDPNTALRVTATEENDCRALFSNFSPASNPTFYNIAAPGYNILSLSPNNGYRYLSGTSMASPMVAGAAALVWGKTPSLTRGQVVNKLVSTGEKTSCGFVAPTPRLDVRKALLGTSETAIVGQLLDPETGNAASPPATAKLFSGTTLLKSDATNESGFYEMTGLTAGTGRTLKVTGGSGFVNANLRKGISIVSGAVAGPSTDALPQARPTGNATVTIDWKTLQPIFDLSFLQVPTTSGCVDTCNGWEFDLILKLSDGSCCNYVHASRDSSGDFLNLDPVETVVLGSEAANGTYKVIANKRPDPAGDEWNPSWNGSQASVQMYNGAASLGGGLKAVPSTCGTNKFWYVGDLTKSGTSYTWTPNKNPCTNTEP
jgi:thermitase